MTSSAMPACRAEVPRERDDEGAATCCQQADSVGARAGAEAATPSARRSPAIAHEEVLFRLYERHACRAMRRA